MSSFTPLHRTYSALSYSLSSFDEVHSDKSVSQPRKPKPRTISRYSFHIRFAIFIVLESAFIALVFTALHKPILLQLSFTVTEVKSTVTAIAILWHSIAVVIVKDILLNIFSAEWTEQHVMSRSLTLQEFDIVSRLTTGFIDQLKYCVSKRATHSFRLGFLASLLLVLLSGPIGPSAINVNYVPYVYPDTIRVANISHQVIPDNFLTPMRSRIGAFIELEAVGHSTTLGLSGSQSNILIPWPSSESISDNITINYSSDVIRTNFNCSWNEPSFRDLSPTHLSVGDQRWDIEMGTSDLKFPEGAFAYTLTGPQDHPSVIALLLGNGGSYIGPVNFEGIPSVPLPCKLSVKDPVTVNNSTIAWSCIPNRRASVLICDPQIEILPAIVNATASSLQASISPGMSAVGNIPTEAANYVLRYTSLLADWENHPEFAALLFFETRGIEGIHPPGAGRPLSLPEINHNMTSFMASATKAYLSGYPNFVMLNTSGEIGVQEMALVGSKIFFIALTATVSLLVPMLGILVVMTRPDQLECFDLENIVKRLQIGYFSDSTSTRDVSR